MFMCCLNVNLCVKCGQLDSLLVIISKVQNQLYIILTVDGNIITLIYSNVLNMCMYLIVVLA